MSRFVITITPETADADGAASALTTVRVDTSTGHTRITELTVRAADGDGLAPADLPAVDLELLIRALGAPSAIRALPTDTETEMVHLATPAEMAEAVEPSEVAAEPTGAPGRAAKRAAGGRRAGGRSATGRAGRAGGRAGGGRAAKKAAGRAAAGTEAGTRTGRKAARAGGAAAGRGRKAAAGEGQTRAYRRMPEPAEVLDAYAQTGSITRLAEHFGVPRHTANGWARRLRRQGYAIGRS